CGDLFKVGHQLIEKGAQYLAQDQFFGREVMIEAARKNTSLIGDVAHSGETVSFRGKQPCCDVENLLSSAGSTGGEGSHRWHGFPFLGGSRRTFSAMSSFYRIVQPVARVLLRLQQTSACRTS